ncbi:helix-turn-helix domain-containing protein [Nocardia higoensis]|uniref:helix-turn-helix domain-containing protein n=1 Tax=Nocardia higoensis TaxID=228599 RepID=UPI00031E1678|nr:helix-turn-helix domain-containing protein [Nocardia higoensis]
MPAKTPVRRTKTARELAEQFGASDRTIRRMIAEPRADYESRAEEKRRRAQKLRAEGATYRQIADELGVGIGSVSSLLRVPVRAD